MTDAHEPIRFTPLVWETVANNKHVAQAPLYGHIEISTVDYSRWSVLLSVPRFTVPFIIGTRQSFEDAKRDAEARYQTVMNIAVDRSPVPLTKEEQQGQALAGGDNAIYRHFLEWDKVQAPDVHCLLLSERMKAFLEEQHAPVKYYDLRKGQRAELKQWVCDALSRNATITSTAAATGVTRRVLQRYMAEFEIDKSILGSKS